MMITMRSRGRDARAHVHAREVLLKSRADVGKRNMNGDFKRHAL